MKKLLLAFAAALVCSAALAQENGGVIGEKGFLVVAAGPAIPVGDFASTDMENENAGMAKTGYTINLHGGYFLAQNLGLKATGFYSRHQVENSFTSLNVDISPWQYYGLTVGPMYRVPLAANIDLNLAGEVGIANALSPQASLDGEVLMKEDWSLTMPLKGEAALHFRMASNMKLMLGANYQYMKPTFDIASRDESDNWISDEVRQRMNVVNVFAGIGISF